MRSITRLMTTLIAVALLLAPCGEAFAQSVGVVEDDGTGSAYKTLPTNYVQILDLYLGHAVIEQGPGYSIQYGYAGAQNNAYVPMLMYTGKLNFGTKNATNDADASLAANTLPDVVLRFPNAAVASDGSTLFDIKMTLSGVSVALGKNSLSTNTLGIHVMMDWGQLNAAPPKSSYAKADSSDSSGAATAASYNVTMQVVDCGTNTPISSSKYPTMLVEFTDLDIVDKTIKKSSVPATRGDGYYAEGVTMLSGWTGNAVIGPYTGVVGQTRLVNVQSQADGTKIKVDGDWIQAYIDKFNPVNADCNTLWSGFVAGVTPQGFSFRWTGSTNGNKSGGMGTTIGGQPTVAVKAMREGVGASASYLGSDKGGTSGVNSWYTNTHLMNTNSTYTVTPASGYFIDYVKVDGVEQTLTEAEKKSGYSYEFVQLNKYPLPQINMATGQVLAAASSYYTIQAKFDRYPKYEAKKIADRASVRLGSDEEITYQISIDEIYSDAVAGTHEIHDDLAGGILKIVPGSVTVLTEEHGTLTCDDTDYSDGLDMTFTSDAADGSYPRAALQYKATIDWDAYAASADPKITNDAAGYNKPEVGGGRTGNPVTLTVTQDVKVTKTVTGKLRSMTKKFALTVDLEGLDGSTGYAWTTLNGGELTQVISGKASQDGFIPTDDGRASLTFSASGGQGFTLHDLPVGCTYKVTEAASNHTASYTVTSDSDSAVIAGAQAANAVNMRELATETETLDKTDGLVTVAFTNRREPAPVMGVLTGRGWMTAAAVIAAAAAVLIITGRCRQSRRHTDPATGGEEVRSED